MCVASSPYPRLPLGPYRQQTPPTLSHLVGGVGEGEKVGVGEAEAGACPPSPEAIRRKTGKARRQIQ